MKLTEALEKLKPLCMGVPEATEALRQYATLAEQGSVLAEFLPEEGSNAILLKRGESGFRRLEETLLAKLGTLIPVNEGALESLAYDDGPLPPLTDIPFLPWYPHGEELLGEYVNDLPEAERLASLLSWGVTPEQLAVAFDLLESPDFTVPKYDEAIAALERQPEPIRFLADALRVVNKITGVYIWDGLCDASHDPSHVTGAVM